MDLATRREILGAVAAPGAQNSPRSEVILLDRNENPYGPFPAVLQAVRASLDSINRHPRTYAPLVEEIAGLHRARCDQVLLGVGPVTFFAWRRLHFLEAAPS